MVAGIQGSRMNDQRASLPQFPGLHNSQEIISHLLNKTDEKNALDDQFFEMLMRCQVRKGSVGINSVYNDVIKWKHLSHYWPFVRGIHRWPVNSPHKGQWHGALMFCLICAGTNGWINNGDAGDLRWHRAYDATVMNLILSFLTWVGRKLTHCCLIMPRDQSRYVPGQWETSLQCNDVSHWLGAYLDWSLHAIWLHRSGSTLAQVMTCKPLPKPMLTYSQLSIAKISLKITYLKISFKSPRGQWIILHQ